MIPGMIFGIANQYVENHAGEQLTRIRFKVPPLNPNAIYQPRIAVARLSLQTSQR